MTTDKTQGIPGMGKSRLMRKWVKKHNKKRKKQGLPKLALSKWVRAAKLSAGDYMGFLTPVTQPSNDGPFCKPRSLIPTPVDLWDADKYPSGTTFHADGRVELPPDELEPVSVTHNDPHSPTWLIDSWLVLREEYGAQLTRQLGDDATQADHDAHIQDCDEALVELEAAAARVNKLFNYPKE